MSRKPLDPSRSTREKGRISSCDYQRRRREHIQVQPCEVCGGEPAECHHIDYSDPTRRMWLCSRCHGAYHSQFGKPAPADWMADIRAAQKRIEGKRPSLRQRRAQSTGED